jgi:hypothetical protein
MDAAPGKVRPRVSAMQDMVEAVPMVMQWPGERAMPSSMPRQTHSLMLPAQRSAQYFQASVPLPSVVP